MKKIFMFLAIWLLLFGCATQNSEKTSDSNWTKSNVVENETGEIKLQEVIAEKGDNVAVDYLGMFDNGTLFDTSIKEEAVKAKLPLRQSYSPLEFTVGAGQMIKGFDSAVIGMKEGEEKTVHLIPSEAYGERNEEYVFEFNRSQVPDNIEIGSRVQASNGAIGKVVNLSNETITVDFNHELAGKALNFKIIMRKITKAHK